MLARTPQLPQLVVLQKKPPLWRRAMRRLPLVLLQAVAAVLQLEPGVPVQALQPAAAICPLLYTRNLRMSSKDSAGSGAILKHQRRFRSLWTRYSTRRRRV